MAIPAGYIMVNTKTPTKYTENIIYHDGAEDFEPADLDEMVSTAMDAFWDALRHQGLTVKRVGTSDLNGGVSKMDAEMLAHHAEMHREYQQEIMDDFNQSRM